MANHPTGRRRTSRWSSTSSNPSLPTRPHGDATEKVEVASPALPFYEKEEECGWKRLRSSYIPRRPSIRIPSAIKVPNFLHEESEAPRIHTYMWSFQFWLLLREQLDRDAYNDLFRQELERLLSRLTNPIQRQHAESMLVGFNFTNYIAAAVRRSSGAVNQDEIDEKIHEIAIRMLVSPGGLFRDYDERKHGPFNLRFRRTLANMLKNLAERERNRKRYIPSVPIRQEFEPGGVTADDLVARGTPEGDPQLLDDFRELVQRHLGAIAVRVFDARLEGIEMKSLPGISSYVVKKTVQEIKSLAKKYAIAVGDPSLLHRIEKLMAAEEMTVKRRKAAMSQRVAARG